ncbi:MAG TPA: Holliday junction resolvase-like protein [Candidatus Thermoplasmatota archaeon]|nr:Holliday junction resolvase-like protein [Candidatus Thermoplasmatota archaeon]
MTDPVLYLSMLVIGLALALAIVVRAYADRVSKLKERVRELDSSKRSLSSTYGNITEQWAPFMSGYPYDPRNFRFLGSPVDGVQFEDDKVVFVEFKANGSRLSPRESRIRQLVEQGRVEWLEYRLATREGALTPPPTRVVEDWGAERP